MIKSAKLIAAGVLLLCASHAHATEPDSAAVKCLNDVLLTASNAVSVKPADDWVFIYPDENYRSVRKGVQYSFHKPDGTEQTIGIYLDTEFKFQLPHLEPNEVALGCCFVPDDNGRFALILRPPFPGEWYPRAKAVFLPPNITSYIRQDSKDHPLYALWDKLESQCRIDNQELNSPVVP